MSAQGPLVLVLRLRVWGQGLTMGVCFYLGLESMFYCCLLMLEI